MKACAEPSHQATMQEKERDFWEEKCQNKRFSIRKERGAERGQPKEHQDNKKTVPSKFHTLVTH
jgi:hypothetical protein